MTALSHPVGDRSTKTAAYAQMRQMQQFEVGAGEVTKVTMKEVQAIETLAQLEAARRRFGLGYDQLDRVVPRTKSLEYAGTPLVQAGHRIKSATMTGGKLRPMGEMIEQFVDKPQTYEAAKRIAEEHGIKPEDEVWTDFDITIELEKAP